MQPAVPSASATDLRFDDPALLEALESAEPEAIDRAEFGVIALSRGGEVRAYNAYEAALSGLDPARVLGRPFFRAVAPCMIRGGISERFRTAERLDERREFVLTLRVKPTPVTLRLLKAPGARRAYILVRRRQPA